MLEDAHYTVDDTTQKITFCRDAYFYLLEKKVFAKHSVDIDCIKMLDEYLFFKNEYRHDINAVLKDKWLRREPKTHDERQIQQTMLETMELLEKMRQRRTAGKPPYLRVIK